MKPALVAAGCKPAPLGLINELLYAAAEANAGAFHDVTEGSNECKSNTDNCCGPHGFQAAQGWDAVTGLGSPNVESLVNVAIKLCKK